jgi:hypothetical protein
VQHGRVVTSPAAYSKLEDSGSNLGLKQEANYFSVITKKAWNNNLKQDKTAVFYVFFNSS